MQFKYLLAVFSVVFLIDFVFADGENEIKGMYPYMAFIYYSDESVMDTTGNRFLRGAILITKDWLVTSAVQISENDSANDVAFPRKTLLARLGAISIDSKFTLNEDEDEQEREIIQIVRPYNHSATQWWRTDITLMHTLLPFNLTSTVGLAPGNNEFHPDKPCFILTYARRYGNLSEERILTQWSVDVLPPSIVYCGSHFFETMICAIDSDDNKNEFHDQTNFCQGNSGGPLVCDSSVVGLQTYIDNNCNSPHLYQLLSPWNKFMYCATNDKCDAIDCKDMCAVTNKDAPLTLETPVKPAITHETSLPKDTPTATMSAETTIGSNESTTMTIKAVTITPIEDTTNVTEEETPDITTVQLALSSTVVVEDEPEPVVQVSAKPTNKSTQVPRRSHAQTPKQTEGQANKSETIATNLNEETTQKQWPKEKEDSIQQVQEEECDEVMRKTNVEAQQNPWLKTPIKTAKGAAERNVCVFHRMFFIFVLTSFL